MNFENIQSPLPARRPSVGDETPSPIAPPIPAATAAEATPVGSGSMPPQSSGSNNPMAPKAGFDLKKLLPWAGIGGLIILIGILAFGVIIPKLSNKPAKTITLNYWGMWEDSSVLQSLIDEFEANNPGIKINYTHNDKTNYRTRLAGKFGKANDPEAPDIFRLHASWMPMFSSNLAKVPTDVASKLQLDNDFYDAYKRDIKLGTNYMGVPLMYDQLALYYNKDILAAAQKTPPRTWWGLRETAKQLTVLDSSNNIQVAGVALGTVENVDHWSDIIGLMMKQNNVDLLANDAANKTKLQAILTFYTLFKTADHVWDESLADSTTQFANGKLAFYFAPSWRVFNLQEMNPNLNYAITGVPQLPTLEGLPDDKVESGEVDGQLTTDQWSSYWFEGVNNRSKNQAAAWKFLEFLASKEALEKFYTAASQIRDFGELYPRKSMAAELSSNEKAKIFVTNADNGGNWYLSSRTFDDGLNDEMSKYFLDAINGVLHNNQSVDEVYPTLKSGIDQVVSKYKITKKIGG